MPDRFKTPEFFVVVLVICMAFTLSLVCLLFKLPVEKDIELIVVNTFDVGGFMTALNYAVGTSASSKAKDDTIAAAVKK